MATVMVLVSGWIGFAVAVAQQLFSNATVLQFFGTWMMSGLLCLAAFAAATFVHKWTAAYPAQQA